MSIADRPILSLNSHLIESAGVFTTKENRATDHFGNDTSDGPEIDIRIDQENRSDLMSLNHIKMLNLNAIDKVLEISYDYGATTEILQAATNKSFQLDVIKSDFFQALGSLKLSTQNDVCAIADDLANIDLPKGYYDFISVYHIAQLGTDEISRTAILKKLSDALSEKGVLSICFENENAPRRWFDADWQPNILAAIDGEPNKVSPFSNIYKTNNISNQNVMLALEGLGLNSQNQQCLLPNLQEVRTIISRDYLNNQTHSLNHFYGADIVSNDTVSSYLLLDSLKNQRHIADCCSGIWLVAGKSKSHVEAIYKNDFSHFSGVSRERQWRTITEKPRGLAKVTKKKLFPELKNSDELLQQDLSEQVFNDGEILATRWLRALLLEDGGKQLYQLITEYRKWLNNSASEFGESIYDILPFNIIIGQHGEYQVFDDEWSYKESLSLDFVLFRAIFWFAMQNKHHLKPLAQAKNLYTIGDFVQHIFDRLRISADLRSFCVKEEAIQSRISAASTLGSASDSFDMLIDGEFVQQNADVPQCVAHVYFGQKLDNGYQINPRNRVETMFTVKDELVECQVLFDGLDISGNVMRIDPVKTAGFFKLGRIELQDVNGQEIWSLKGQKNIATVADMANVEYSHSSFGGVFMAGNDDAQLFFDLSGISIKNANKLVFDVSWSGGSEYAAVMSQLGNVAIAKQHIIDDQSKRLDDQSKRLQEVSTLQRKVDQQKAHIQELLKVVHGSKLSRVKRAIARRLNHSADVTTAANPALTQRVLSDDTKFVGQSNTDYQVWIEHNRLSDQETYLMRQEIEEMAHKPVFSIVVPVYNIEEKWLRKAVDSVINQVYPHWQLCLVDDASPKEHIRPLLKQLATEDERISIRLNEKNGGIAKASQDGIEIATGDYIALLDHDDELAPNALFENAKLINQNPSYGLIYSDEDKVEMSGRRVDPFFKPDYSPELLESQNYICHFTVMRKDIVDRVGGFRFGYDGSQDHDIILRVANAAEKVGHIPKILKHCRKVTGSTDDVYDSKSYAWEAGRKAVEASVEASQEKADVVLGPLQGSYRVQRMVVGEPSVSIIIPFKDRPDLLQTCIESIMRKSTYQNFKILGVSNTSELSETQQMMADLTTKYERVSFVEKNEPFNFSMLCNFGVNQTTGDYIVLLNNDIELISSDWLETMLGHAQRDDIGAVGGKLYYPDGRIQHAGIVTGMFGVAGHPHVFFGAHDDGYYARLRITSNVSAVTGAMLMVSRQKYNEVNGLDEQEFAIAYNDVDFCLRLLEKGYRNVFTPFVEATHYESASRGYEDNPEKSARLATEQANFKTRWEGFLAEGDPYYNSNFDLEKPDFSIKL